MSYLIFGIDLERKKHLMANTRFAREAKRAYDENIGVYSELEIMDCDKSITAEDLEFQSRINHKY